MIKRIIKRLLAARRLRKESEVVSGSSLFDSAYYKGQLKENGLKVENVRLAEHYLRIGESKGLKPSQVFDPSEYRAINADVASKGVSPLLHYINFGLQEGRRTSLLGEYIPKLVKLSENGRPTIVVATHEMSRTGAPILALNIVRNLRVLFGYNIVVFSWRGKGDLEEMFKSSADVIIAPVGASHYSLSEIDSIMAAVKQHADPAYMIANSGVLFRTAIAAENAGIPVLGLVHEFSSLLGGDDALAHYFSRLSEVVFPAETVRNSVLDDHPAMRERQTHIIPQGKSEVRFGVNLRGQRKRPLGKGNAARATLSWALRDNDVLVVGLGTMEWRKGLDTFVASAAAFKRATCRTDVRFAWVGDYHSGSYEASLYVEEQISRSAVEDTVIFLPGTPDIQPIYERANVYILCPRLDPFPNVAIDMFSLGVPTICMQGGTGIADVMASDELLRECLTPYGDAEAIAEKLSILLNDPSLMGALSAREKEISATAFDMRTYVGRIDSLMRKHAVGKFQAEGRPTA